MKHFYKKTIGKSRSPQKETRRRLSWLVIAAGAALLITTTFAFLYAITGSALNPFSFGKTTITIEEDFKGWDVKEVRLKNDQEDNVPGVVRAMFVIVLKDKDTGSPLGGDYDPYNEIGLVFAADWEDGWFFKDGFYYYREVLLPGDTTSPLLEKAFVINDTPQMWKKYANVIVEIEVMADILQASGGAPEAVWGVTVSGMTVSPI